MVYGKVWDPSIQPKLEAFENFALIISSCLYLIETLADAPHEHIFGTDFIVSVTEHFW